MKYNFSKYLYEKLGIILLIVSFIFIQNLFLYLIGVVFNVVLLITISFIICSFVYYIIDFLRIRNYYIKMLELIDGLKQKYLISELLEKPEKYENYIYYYALKKANKSMCEEINNINLSKQQYQEYIEEWVHEIKTPISYLSLLSVNLKNDNILNEVTKINNLVEQVLYFARSDNVEKDYFIKEINLSDIIHSVLIKNKSVLLKENFNIKTDSLDKSVFTDEKWLNYIINQIINNSIKYADKKEKHIKFYANEDNNGVILTIEDNGTGINKSDLPRIFDKGFTGTNREKQHSTGIGLYICKKLCDKLNILINAESKESEFTKINITFPKGKLNKF
jgi:signal transduction histidine kinase